MASSRKMVQFFYDIVSPYSWMAFEVVCSYKNVWNIDLKFKPVYLGGVMHGSSNRPPGMAPNNFHYMTKDLERVSGYFGVPLYPPSDVFEAMFDKGTLNAMRFVTAVAKKEQEGGVLVERVSRELWKRIWSTDQDVTQPASLTEAGLKAGLSASELEEILTLSKSQPIKDKLKSVTQEALDYQCFGFPFTVCHVNGKAELFFVLTDLSSWLIASGEKWVGPHPDKPTFQM
uniref:Glutathione S-transferase kappa n=1 Tax=Cyprinus carpio TaxID=7962 RepID=Q0GZP6_CYPCA|nr:glutathione S-transferase kappa [Cyprinus carpio]